MKIARYWTRAAGEAANPYGRRIRVTARGWSDDSLDLARIRAQQIAQRVAERVADQPGDAPLYPYGDRPLPEPVLSEFSDADGKYAIVTRNSYGALVMNTDRMMFVDIDRVEVPFAPQAGLKGLFSSLLGKPDASPAKVVDPVVAAVVNVADRHRLSGRIYRTAGGYRVLISNRRFAVKASETNALLNEFHADPLYVRLCRQQESFRARLTPKPWRLGIRQPPVEFPFETSAAQARFNEWLREYEAESVGRATCAFQSAFGMDGVPPEFEALIRFHDGKTKATSGLSLA